MISTLLGMDYLNMDQSKNTNSCQNNLLLFKILHYFLHSHQKCQGQFILKSTDLHLEVVQSHVALS